ncbi:MAG: LysR family transcriptional regulator [Gammaproteobacteria bacterium]|nr:LysR family transcriptional regulator [Gammaproteobacteria bacterium]
MIDQKLLTLLTVCETKNYSKASKKLNLTQPAISQHISQLEKELDIKIFNRNNNEMKLTDKGEILVKYARRIVSLYNDLDTELDDARKNKNSLIVGITHSSEGGIFPLVFAKYCEKNKGTHIKIICDSIKNLYDKLQAYEIDLAIVDGSYPSTKYSMVSLDTDFLVAILSKDNPLSKKSIININDLKMEKMILRPITSATRLLFEAHIESINMSIEDFNVVLELDNVTSIKDLVKKNYGISILPKSVCHQESKDNSLIIRPIENLTMIREVNLVYQKDVVEEKILDDLIKIYHEL